MKGAPAEAAPASTLVLAPTEETKPTPSPEEEIKPAPLPEVEPEVSVYADC